MERRTDQTDPPKPTGLRGVFLKQETPPSLWDFLPEGYLDEYRERKRRGQDS